MNPKIMIAVSVLALSTLVWADPKHEPQPVKGSPEFERIKQLAGIWNGSSKTGKEKRDATAVYQVTSGGQAVTETLFAGTPHEMVSVYYDQGGKLTMTHYCMLPNRPVLELKKATAKAIDLSLTAASGIPASEHHMHSLSLAWKGPDKLTQKWTSWTNGKPGESTVITLSRVK